MATIPIFIASAFAAPCATVDAIDSDDTGGGTYDSIITGAPSQVTGIAFIAISPTIECELLIFHDDGSNVKLIDVVRIYQSNPAEFRWKFTWYPEGGPMLLAASDEIQASMTRGSAVLHARAIGGNL
jgi:hypothetical protein